jgi:hypothetical protein
MWAGNEGTYVLRYGASSLLKKVIAFPGRPARPVRPILWMYDWTVWGKSRNQLSSKYSFSDL